MGSVGMGIVLMVLHSPRNSITAQAELPPFCLIGDGCPPRLRRGSLCEKPYLRSLNRGNTRKRLELAASNLCTIRLLPKPSQRCWRRK